MISSSDRVDGVALRASTDGKRGRQSAVEVLQDTAGNRRFVRGSTWKRFRPEVEQRLRQHDRILRFLTVRLDQGRLRHRERMPQIGQAPVKGGGREASAS